MKNLKTIIAIITVSIVTVFSISATNLNTTEVEENKTLRTEISSFLGKDIPIKLEKATTVKISFIVNNKNELVVLSVQSKILKLEYFLKRTLNYQKITAKGVKKGKIYRMPIKINID